ncbi:hypothetical protein ABFX02_11G091000 [Erythranthe guttata]
MYIYIYKTIKLLFKPFNFSPSSFSICQSSSSLRWERDMISKMWKMLISSFGCESRPLIIRYYRNEHVRVSIIDGNSEKECRSRALESVKFCYVVGSCNGLILLSKTGMDLYDRENRWNKHVVLNPNSKNRGVTIINGPSGGGTLCGFFFHPKAKECRILSVRQSNNNQFEYHLYLFGEKRWRSTKKPYFSYRPDIRQRSLNFETRIDDRPAIANDALHWCISMVGEIMVFNMVTEDFSTKPCPVVVDKGGCHLQHLSVKDNQLCFCSVDREDQSMDIWILENYTKWSWVRKYVVHLDWDLNKYAPGEDFLTADFFSGVKVICIQKNELVLFWVHRGIFSYRLDKNTVKRIRLRKSHIMRDYDWLCGFQAYHPFQSINERELVD